MENEITLLDACTENRTKTTYIIHTETNTKIKSKHMRTTHQIQIFCDDFTNDQAITSNIKKRMNYNGNTKYLSSGVPFYIRL